MADMGCLWSLNEVRSWRPEQSTSGRRENLRRPSVSMKSGLGDRNNRHRRGRTLKLVGCLNEVRSWRPEQSVRRARWWASLAPEVSMKSGLGDRNNAGITRLLGLEIMVSMKSGLGDRNNPEKPLRHWPQLGPGVSMKSGLGDRNNGSPRKAVLTRDFTKVCERSVPQAPATPLC